MMLQTESGIWAQADARVFAMLMAPNRTARRKLAAERTIDAAVRRVAALRRRRAAAASREHLRAERALEQEARDLERAWGRTLRVRMPAPKKRVRTGERKAALHAATSLARRPRAYRQPIKDKRGRVALIFITKYVGLKSKGWRPGLAAEHISYIFRDAALEEFDDALPHISNVGESIEEIAAFWTVLESIEQGYRANAKIQHRIIWNLPHELNAEQRRELVRSFCERTFGRLGLPYAAAIHAPDPAGDQRNFHAHICWSTRPFERAGDYDWIFAAEKVNGLDDPDGLRRLRALAAAHMNLACIDAGLATRFTHQTYAERGLDARRQDHVGPAAMAAYRKGEDVAVVARNAAIVEVNEAAVEAQRVEEAVAASERLIGLLRRGEALAALRQRAAETLGRAEAIGAAAKTALSHVSRRDPAALSARVSRIHDAAISTAARRAARARGPSLLVPAIQVRRAAEQVTSALSRRKPRAKVSEALLESIDLRRQAERLAGSTPRPTNLPHQAVTLLSARAASIVSKAAPRPAASSSPTSNEWLAETAPRVPHASGRLQASRDRARIADGHLERINAALAEHRRAERRQQEAAVRAIIMATPHPPYRLEKDKLVGVLSGLTAQELSLVRSVDRAVLEMAVRARLARDQEDVRRDTKVAAEKAAEEARAAAARTALIADACRILRETKQRPYRRQDGELVPDWSGLAARDRAVLDEVGTADEQLQVALAERARSDQARDAGLVRLFHLLETERHYLPQDGERRTVDQRLLDFLSIDRTALDEPKVQARLQAIADLRNRELEQIASYAQAEPGQFVREAGVWSARETSSPAIRALVQAWESNETFQKALGRKLEAAQSRLAGRGTKIARDGREPQQLAKDAVPAGSTPDTTSGPGTAPSNAAEEHGSASDTPRKALIPPWLRGQGPGIGG